MIVVIAILGILAAIAVPRLAGFQGSANEKAILSEIRTIESAAVAHYSTLATPVWTFNISELGTYLDADVLEKYKDANITVGEKITFDTSGKVQNFTLSYGGSTYAYDSAEKTVTKNL